jgi:hypothetical protein
MPRKTQRPRETDESDGWQKAKVVALLADAFARLLDVLDGR